MEPFVDYGNYSSQYNKTENFSVDGYDEEESSWTAVRIQRVITLSVLMTMSLIGNSVIIIILACSRSHKHLNRVNVFIINLAMGDLAVCCITMTSELILEIYGEWKLGNIGCKVIMYTQVVTLASTTYILMAMSWDRYQAICRPLDFNPSPSKAQRMVLIAWALALISSLPYFFIYVQVEVHSRKHDDGTNVYSCDSVGYREPWMRKLNFVWLTCSVLIIPAIWISYCYFNLARVVWQQGNCQQTVAIDGSTLLRKTCDIRVIPRAKIKTMKMSLIIVITFVVCWTPYFVVYNVRIFSDDTFTFSESVVAFVETLALVNSTINPVIYGCFNVKTRQGLREVCTCFNINVQADKSQMSEQSASTSSTIHLKSVRRTPGYSVRSQRKLTSGEPDFDFAQSTRHIQNNYHKLLRDYRHNHNRYNIATSKI